MKYTKLFCKIIIKPTNRMNCKADDRRTIKSADFIGQFSRQN